MAECYWIESFWTLTPSVWPYLIMEFSTVSLQLNTAKIEYSKLLLLNLFSAIFTRSPAPFLKKLSYFKGLQSSTDVWNAGMHYLFLPNVLIKRQIKLFDKFGKYLKRIAFYSYKCGTSRLGCHVRQLPIWPLMAPSFSAVFIVKKICMLFMLEINKFNEILFTEWWC